MFRWILTLIVVAAIVAAAGYLAREPGLVVIDWRGYHFESSFAIMVLGAVLAIGVILLVFRLWWFILRSPRGLYKSYQQRKQRRGFDAVSRGLVAVAAGDPDGARRYARKAESSLGNRSLSMLLSAQSAQLDGDDQAAKRFFEAMQEQWDTEFLGVRGLLMQAIKREDWAEALSLAKRAYTLNPKSGWVVQTLFDLQKRTQQWTEAKATLEEARRSKLLPSDVIRAEMGDILYQQSLSADPDTAIQAAKEAHKADTTSIPAAVRFASLLAEAGLTKRAARVVQDVWAVNPDRQLAEIFWSTQEWKDAKGKLDATKRLTKKNPNHMESRLLIGECAIAAKRWSEARFNIEPYASEDSSPRICRLMAALEEGDTGDADRVRTWLMRASKGFDLPVTVTQAAETSSDAVVDGDSTVSTETETPKATKQAAPVQGTDKGEVEKKVADTPTPKTTETGAAGTTTASTDRATVDSKEQKETTGKAA
jgi:HemY protein